MGRGRNFLCMGGMNPEHGLLMLQLAFHRTQVDVQGTGGYLYLAEGNPQRSDQQ